MRPEAFGRRRSAWRPETRPSRRRRERGAALVEFALLLPLLITLILGTIDFGYMVNRDTLINSAAKEGAREASLNPDAAAVEAVVRSDLSSLEQASLTVTTTCRKADDTACSTFDADAEPGGVAIVNVQYDYAWVSFIPSAIGLGATASLTKTIEMRIE
jgi:Flp pilus assembly protein TadG